MVMIINLGIEREKRLMKHLEKEYPSTKNNMIITSKEMIAKRIIEILAKRGIRRKIMMRGKY